MNRTLFPLVAAGVAALDLATKALVRRELPLHADIPLLPFFSLVHVENTGIAFGMFPGWNTFFIGVGVGIAAVIAWMGWHASGGAAERTALGLVLGGAIGNLTDRIVYGRVTDFLDFHLAGAHWPAFNVADAAICTGAGLFLLTAWRWGRR